MHWFLEHQLLISTFRATLEGALNRTDSSVPLLRWSYESDLRDHVMVHYPDGRRVEHRVAPDGYFAALELNEVRNFFVEVDRGTEEHPRILAKMQSYWWYLSPRSPFHEQYENSRNTLVLFVCTTERRMEAMRKTLARVDPQGRGLRQFWFTTSGDYSLGQPGSILQPIWRVGPTRAGSPPQEHRVLFDALQRQNKTPLPSG
jgi:hypothetical protein